VSREFGVFYDSLQVERNSLPMRVFAVNSDMLMQKVNGDNGIIVGGMLTQRILPCLILTCIESLKEICKSSDNGNKTYMTANFLLF
jgi:hypothetical protein